jgi:hypothetical protein
LGFDLHPNPSPSPNKPIGTGASWFGKPKSALSLNFETSRIDHHGLDYSSLRQVSDKPNDPINHRSFRWRKEFQDCVRKISRHPLRQDT